MNPLGFIITVAGSGEECFSGDGGLAINAILTFPEGVAVDPDGNIFIADQNNQRIRKVDSRGIITTVAGSGPVGFSAGDFSGDGGSAVSSRLNFSSAVVPSADGSLIIADSSNGRARRIDAQGIITTVAANFGGVAADVAVAPDGGILVIDSFRSLVHRADAQGLLTTYAGNGLHDFGGDGGPAISASLNTPNGIGVGPDGSLSIADTSNNRLRKVDPFGIMTTVACNGDGDFSGDGGPATEAALRGPRTVAEAPDGSLFIADKFNNRIRKVIFFEPSPTTLLVQPAEIGDYQQCSIHTDPERRGARRARCGSSRYAANRRD